jgi:hypothetical protein
MGIIDVSLWLPFNFINSFPKKVPFRKNVSLLNALLYICPLTTLPL